MIHNWLSVSLPPVLSSSHPFFLHHSLTPFPPSYPLSITQVSVSSPIMGIIHHSAAQMFTCLNESGHNFQCQSKSISTFS